MAGEPLTSNLCHSAVVIRSHPFFRTLEEELDFDIPKIVMTAKQIILNKAGISTPLNKRLITILSPLILAYTGTRFRQLNSWQEQVFPSALCGGIKGRSMSTVNVGLQVELDQASFEGDAIVGIKLDQSKCFDRIVPDFAAILFLAFGMPKKVVNVFLKMYGALRKHLSFRGWVSCKPVSCANGVAQGCSLSLIAINVYMAVWARFMSLLPEVMYKAFIDDAYIWVRLAHVDVLHRAFEATRQWNKLVGQKLNPDKCTLWATTGPARERERESQKNLPRNPPRPRS